MNRQLQSLQDIAEIINGVFVSTSSLEASDESVLVLSVRSLTGASLDLAQVDQAEVSHEDRNRCKVHPGDVLISSRSTSISTGIVPAGIGDAVLNSTLIGIRLKQGTIHPRLLVAWLQSGLGQSHFESISQSTTRQMNVTVKELRTLPVPIFTAQEQAAMLSLLEASDIAYNAAITAAEIRRSVALQMVTDVLIGRTKIKNG